jgi:hypothetical protein
MLLFLSNLVGSGALLELFLGMFALPSSACVLCELSTAVSALVVMGVAQRAEDPTLATTNRAIFHNISSLLLIPERVMNLHLTELPFDHDFREHTEVRSFEAIDRSAVI